jgi:hypothetical protein
LGLPGNGYAKTQLRKNVDWLGNGMCKNLDSFSPSRGLRQRDPLSPYLFLLVAEGLSTLLNKEIVEGNLHELHISRHAPGISHLLFADDSLLFVKGTEDQAQVVKEYFEYL